MPSRMLPLGYHVAPFLSREGLLVLLAMDVGGRLLGMVEVVSTKGEHSREWSDGTRYTLNDTAQFEAPRERFNPRRLWASGVHVAPWCDAPRSTVLVAIDAESRLVATMTANTSCEVAGVRRALEALLEAGATTRES